MERNKREFAIEREEVRATYIQMEGMGGIASFAKGIVIIALA
jgi:hypothetical protein